jgi:hypothetical protein
MFILSPPAKTHIIDTRAIYTHARIFRRAS